MPYQDYLTYNPVKSAKSSWKFMLARCNDPTCVAYPRYGAVGITVHPSWLDFDTFVTEMGTKPEGTTLDRIDSAGNYEPGNCRWATKAEQMRNIASNVWLEHDGKRLIISDWAKELGISTQTIQKRQRRGLPLSEVLKPSRPMKNWRLEAEEMPLSFDLYLLRGDEAKAYGITDPFKP